MIHQDIRNLATQLFASSQEGPMTLSQFNRAIRDLHDIADRVAVLEQAPVPGLLRQAVEHEGVLDFAAARKTRGAHAWKNRLAPSSCPPKGGAA